MLYSGGLSAEGVGRALGVTINFYGIIRNPNIEGRSFLYQGKRVRHKLIIDKHIPDPNKVGGTKSVLIDDSLVSGANSKLLTSKIKAAGAFEVHWVITTPPIKYSCPYPNAIGKRNADELIYNQSGKLAKNIGADSVTYLPLNGFKEVLTKFKLLDSCCLACFTGKAPGSGR